LEAGVEKLSMRTTLIPAEKLRRLLMESTKARLLNEPLTLLCTSCWTYVETKKMRGIEEAMICPSCGSNELGAVKIAEDEVRTALARSERDQGRRRVVDQAKEVSRLYRTFGVAALVALAARRLRLAEVEEILNEEHSLNDHFYELIMEAEREAMRRGFW
jgi:ATP-dependent Lhr-like helicase